MMSEEEEEANGKKLKANQSAEFPTLKQAKKMAKKSKQSLRRAFDMEWTGSSVEGEILEAP